MSVLADWQIRDRCIEHDLVSPFLPELVQPASIDVRLGTSFQVVSDRLRPIDIASPDTFEDLYEHVTVGLGDPISISPKGFVLGCTLERVKIPSNLVGRIEGKSSLARLGLIMESAGYLDPGFEGNVTLEIYNQMPVSIILRPGLSIAQLSFDTMSANPIETYAGKYQHDEGAVGSRYAG